MKPQQNKGKTKSIIMITIAIILVLLLVFAEDIIKLQNKNIIGSSENTAKFEYTTTIGDKVFDITNTVAENANIPTISAGMIPVKWDGEYWTITSKDNWYDYANGKPAYIMLNDGTYQSELIRDMEGKKLAEDNIGAQILENEVGSIYMWLPRYAYNETGEILHIKQGYSVAGSWIMPEIFTYETDKIDFSLGGIWVEYKPLSSTGEVTTKINNMIGEDNKYGFIANTKSIAMNETDSTAIEKYCVGAGLASALNDTTNQNRTILKVTNTKQTEPIKAKAYYDETEEKIKIKVIYSKNGISKILDKKGNVLSENSNIADTGDELIGNGLYKYIVIDNQKQQKLIKIIVTGLDVYIISNEEELKLFRDAVNDGKTSTTTVANQVANVYINEGKYVVDEQTGEIMFLENAEQWIPIGNSSNRAYKGIYNGNGYSISGIYINCNDNYQGLFGYYEGQAIQDLKVMNTSISGKSYVAGIVAYANGTTEYELSNCEFSGNIKATGDYVGGILAFVMEQGSSNPRRTIYNCKNNGIIEGNNYIGGIIGAVSKVYSGNSGGVDITKCCNNANIYGNGYVGGILGSRKSNNKGYTFIKLTQNYNTGYIEGKNMGYVGGIVGHLYSYNDKPSIIQSYNLGDVFSTGNSVGGICGGFQVYSSNVLSVNSTYNRGNITSSMSYAGGILGNGYAQDFTYVYNTGNITAKNYVGGIIGYRSGQGMNGGRNIYNTGIIKCETYGGGIIGSARTDQYYYSYNIGKVEGTRSHVGGICGTITTGTSGGYLIDCYYETETALYGIGGSNLTNGSDSNDCYSSKAKKISMDEMPTILSVVGENFVEDTEGVNNGYPILAWQEKIKQ